MNTPTPIKKKLAGMKKATSGKNSRPTSGKCNSPATARATVRAPQGVAALTSAAMLAAVQSAERTTPQAAFSMAGPDLGLQENFTLGRFLQRAMQWMRHSCQRMGTYLPGQPLRGRILQLVEMQSLGEKRFVAVLRVGSQRFLIGGAAGSVQMLGEVGEQGTTVISPRPQRREKA
jgi:hypothetical protein